MKNYIELQKYIDEFEGMALWKARAHYEGALVVGYALAGKEDCDWYESDPRELKDLTEGLRLPAYMPGHRP